MRKRGRPLSFCTMENQNQFRSSVTVRSSPCTSFSLLIYIQVFVIFMIILTVFKATDSDHGGICAVKHYRHLHQSQTNYSHTAINSLRDKSALLQMNFLKNHGSRLPQAYNDDRSPVPNQTWQKLKAIPLADFCNGSMPKPGPKYAIFKDVMLAGRSLYLPSSINCSTMALKPLTTRFNPGQRSTPQLDIMVVPATLTLNDFQPHISCHERVYEPSFMFSFINWPQYGHALFNGVSLIWEAFSGPLSNAGRNIRLYAYGDSIDSHFRQNAQEKKPFLDLQSLEPLVGMFTNQPVRSLASLLKQSDRHPVCFSYLLVGLSGDLDHYNFAAPLNKWRDFSMAVRSHFGVEDSPRIDTVKSLERLAPKDALKGNMNIDFPIKPIDYEKLLDRPRLTIIDRKSNRIIINVQKLIRIAKHTGFFKRVEVVYLENLNIEQQVHLMGITDVLLGIDGTGLMNGLFLPEGGVVVHVRPYGCNEFLNGKGVNFDRLWSANPGRVIRHESGDINTTRLPSNIPEVAELAFSQNSSTSYRFSFILRQDSLIDPMAFGCILESAHKLLHGIAVDWEAHKACTRTVFF